MDNYKLLEKIGFGSFGTVFKARDETYNEIAAVKQVRVPQTYNGVPLNILREIAVLRQTNKFSHPNIVRLMDLFMCDEDTPNKLMQLTLVFEYIEQDLHQFLHRYPKPSLPANEVKNIVLQLVCGIEFLHSLSIIHRDVKPQNVLISTDGVVKIADFGLAKFVWIETAVTPEVITLWYRSPEVLLNCDYSNKVDMWSLGCIFAELVNRKPLFNGRSELEQLQKIFQAIGVPSEDQYPKRCIISLKQFPDYPKKDISELIPGVSETGIDLFYNLMRFDLAERITAANALEHAWFDDIITFKKPLRMTRQRHSMSLAGPIPSLAEVDTEVEIRGTKRSRSSESPEQSTSTKKPKGKDTPKKDPPKTPIKTPIKPPTHRSTPRKNTPRKDGMKTPKKSDLPKTPKKLTPKTIRKDTPIKKDIPVKKDAQTPKKDLLQTPKKEPTRVSPLKAERERRESISKHNKENVPCGSK